MNDPITAYVIVTGTASEEEDASIPGVYYVGIDADAPADLREEVALESFHENFGIEMLEDFSIVVVDESGKSFPDQREPSDGGCIRDEVDLLDHVAGDACPIDVPEFPEGSVGAELVAELKSQVSADGKDEDATPMPCG